MPLILQEQNTKYGELHSYTLLAQFIGATLTVYHLDKPKTFFLLSAFPELPINHLTPKPTKHKIILRN